MTLEPMVVKPRDKVEDSADLQHMTVRFWVGAALTLPVLVLAMAHVVPSLGRSTWANGDVSRWVQFALATPVVVGAGWPLFRLGWQSIVSRHLNMLTLIAIGVGPAFIFSALSMVAAGLLPHSMQHDGHVAICCEAAAVIVVLVLTVVVSRRERIAATRKTCVKCPLASRDASTTELSAARVRAGSAEAWSEEDGEG
jgi:P-type Cu+ transporter